MRERRRVGPAGFVAYYRVLAFGRQTIRHVIRSYARRINPHPKKKTNQIRTDRRVADFASGDNDGDGAVRIVGALGIRVTDHGKCVPISAVVVDEGSVSETDGTGRVRAH